MNSKDLIDIVDENDNVIGKDTRASKFKKGLISRVVVIFIVDSNKKFLVVKRSPNKKNSPNKYDLSACGNVDSGETYKEAAKRELKEELDIKCELKFLDKMFAEFNEGGAKVRYFVGMFLGKHDGEVKLNDELVELHRLSFEELDEKISRHPDLFCPGFVNDFTFIKKKLKKIITQ